VQNKVLRLPRQALGVHFEHRPGPGQVRAAVQHLQKRGKNWYKAKANVSTQATLAVSATLRLEGLRRIQGVGGIN
jgi:hypothetical protein